VIELEKQKVAKISKKEYVERMEAILEFRKQATRKGDREPEVLFFNWLVADMEEKGIKTPIIKVNLSFAIACLDILFAMNIMKEETYAYLKGFAYGSAFASEKIAKAEKMINSYIV
jgi:hypothetical protein